MTEIINLAQMRFAKAGGCEDVSVADGLREALRCVEAGENNWGSVIVIGRAEDEEGLNWVEMVHAGPANTNDRLGMLTRAQFAMMRD